jgi:predicted PurR-regulated permease PerM
VSDPSRPSATGLINRIGRVSWNVLGVMLLLAAIGWVAVRFRVLLAPIVLAVVLIYVLNPIVSRLHRARVPRPIGAFIAFLVLLGVVALIGWLVLPSLTDQASELASTFPTIYEESAMEVEDLAANFGLDNVDLWSYEELEAFVSDPENQDQFFNVVADRLGAVTSGIFEAILVFFLAPVIAFYVLLDLDRIRDESLELVPAEHRNEVVHVSRNLGHAVGGFLRGQVLVAIIVGFLTSVGFLIIDLPFWLIIGMIAGFLNIIPFVGPWVGGILGVIVALVTRDVETAIWAAVVAFAVQQIDNNFVSPTVMRATVRLHPAVVILVLLAGGAIGGVWGLLLAVPVAASIKILVGHFWRTRVLGQSWEEASEALIEDTAEQESLLTRLRRIADEDEADDDHPKPLRVSGNRSDRRRPRAAASRGEKPPKAGGAG